MAALLQISDDGTTALPEAELLKSNLFAVSTIIECTKDWADRLENQSKSVRQRSDTARNDSLNAPQAEAASIWAEESQSLGEDVDRLSRQLADTNKWISLLARCVKDLMAHPVTGDTLENVLHEVARLKYAYEDAACKFSSLQEEVRPVRREVHRLQARTDAIEVTSEVAANEAVRAIEPLLANLYAQLSAEMDAVRISISRPMERLAASVAQHGTLTPALLQDIVTAIREALAEMWRTTTSIGQFVDGAWSRASAVLSVKVDGLEARLRRLEGGGEGAHFVATTPSATLSIPQLARAVDALTGRVDELQAAITDRDALDRRVRESLARIGFTQDVLRQLFAR